MARWAAGVATAMVVGFLFAPSAARAECGNYVIVGGQATNHDSMADSTVPAKPDSAPRNRPCHGPLCTSAPVTPSQPAPPPSTTSDREPLSASSFFAAAARFDLIATLFDNADQRPVRRASSIFHPPRSL